MKRYYNPPPIDNTVNIADLVNGERVLGTMTNNDKRYLQVIRAMLTLLMDELKDMEVDDDEDEGESEIAAEIQRTTEE